MPIYEFVCGDCNSVYQFFSKRIEPEKVPPCPKHPEHAPMSRQMSRFAMGRSSSKGDATPDPATDREEGPRASGPDPENPLVEARMMDLMTRMESMDENDGRSMGRMMRELASITGEGSRDPAMQEAIRRLESGEDPEKVEQIVSDAYGENALGGPGGPMGEPSFDGGLYDM
ncbi:MAG TPA: zinc ribbon domain-containing protein [Fibrobacteria bacterium]|nr:zinc ribbon domain-containing protein [Fibrobacteria bacterium]